MKDFDTDQAARRLAYEKALQFEVERMLGDSDSIPHWPTREEVLEQIAAKDPRAKIALLGLKQFIGDDEKIKIVMGLVFMVRYCAETYVDTKENQFYLARHLLNQIKESHQNSKTFEISGENELCDCPIMFS